MKPTLELKEGPNQRNIGKLGILENHQDNYQGEARLYYNLMVLRTLSLSEFLHRHTNI
jgi:hypothetical protein